MVHEEPSTTLPRLQLFLLPCFDCRMQIFRSLNSLPRSKQRRHIFRSFTSHKLHFLSRRSKTFETTLPTNKIRRWCNQITLKSIHRNSNEVSSNGIFSTSFTSALGPDSLESALKLVESFDATAIRLDDKKGGKKSGWLVAVACRLGNKKYWS